MDSDETEQQESTEQGESTERATSSEQAPAEGSDPSTPAHGEHDEDDGSEPIDTEDKSDGDVWVDRSKIDFDPDDGLLSGTAIDGGTDIPGPHEIVDDVDPDDSDSDDSDSDDSDSDDSDSDD